MLLHAPRPYAVAELLFGRPAQSEKILMPRSQAPWRFSCQHRRKSSSSLMLDYPAILTTPGLGRRALVDLVKAVGGAAHGRRAAVEHVSVDHGGRHVAVAE